MVNISAENIYILSRDCHTPAAQDRLLYTNTKHLQINNLEDSLVVYSHDSPHLHNHTSTPPQNMTLPSAHATYPRGFSCEVIIHSPLKSAKIMLRIERFYIPSNSDDCVDNLYVFDSNTAKSKAMPEAGGERGLCGTNYPQFPIFTTNPYICIAFHTSEHRPPIPSNQHPGFRLILTAIHDTTTQVCPSGRFYCGLRPSPVRNTGPGLFVDRHPYGTLLTSSSSATTKHRGSDHGAGLSVDQTSVTQLHQAGLGYCISPRTVCDGISNCADGRDESPEQCQRRGFANTEWTESNSQAAGWLSGFLSLGIPASIAIAVSTIVTFTIGIGAVVCCCHRCCRSSPSRVSRYPRITGNSFSRPFGSAAVGGTGYQGGLNECGSAMRPPNRFVTPGEANFTSLLNGAQHGHVSPPFSHPGAMSSLHCGSAQTGHLRSGKIPPGDKQTQDMLSRVVQNPPYSDKGGHSTGAPSGVDMSSGQHQQLFLRPVAHSSVAGSDSYSSIHANLAMGCAPYPNPPGPPPALIPGAMGSPVGFRRDASMMDPCCYTPPPYGACTVPPASSVTASSSRTGTASGNGIPPTHVADPHGSGWRLRGRLHDHPGYLDGVGSAVGGSGTDLCVIDSTGMLFGQQLSGGGNSALHTNTPVETISQTGGDMVSNGGIVYLGEIMQPFHGESVNKFRGASYAGAGSTTTGSGSSHGRAAHSRRMQMQEQTSQSIEFPATASVNTANQLCRTKAESMGYRRPRAPSHRQHRYRGHRSVDPNRATSSGSHTPASSRSGMPTTSSQRSAMEPVQHASAHDLSKSDNSISFPVQL